MSDLEYERRRNNDNSERYNDNYDYSNEPYNDTNDRYNDTNDRYYGVGDDPNPPESDPRPNDPYATNDQNGYDQDNYNSRNDDQPYQNADIARDENPPGYHNNDNYNHGNDYDNNNHPPDDFYYNNQADADYSTDRSTNLPHYVPHTSEARYLNDLPRGKGANFYMNGDPFFFGRRIVHNAKDFKSFTHYLDYLTDKLNPRFGAVQRIHTPHMGHRIYDLKDIEQDGQYVAAGREKFRPMRYDQITRTDRKKSPPYKYDADPVIHSRQFLCSGKYNKIETKSIRIKVWPTGESVKGPRHVLLTPRVRPWTLGNILIHVNEILKDDCGGVVTKLYELGGVHVLDPDQIQHEGEYVACKKGQKYLNVHYKYGSQNFNTSPRLGRKFLPSLYSNSNNTTSQSSPEQSYTSTHNSTNGHSRRAARKHEQGFPAKPVKHTRSSEKVRTDHLSQDEKGVFKKNQHHHHSQGAKEIPDSRHTKTDLPVDQREAREVEDERIKGRKK